MTRKHLLLLTLVLVGAALRWPLLASRSLWSDELAQLAVSGAPDVRALFRQFLLTELHPPLYSLLLHVVLWAGDSELVLRLPSFLLGLAAIVLGAIAGERWAGPRAGLVLAALVCVSPPAVFYSREARPYELGLACELALFAALGGKRGGAVIAATAACVSTLFLAAPVAFFAHLAAWRRSNSRLLLMSLLIAGLVLGGELLLVREVLREHQTVSGKPYLEPFFFEPSQALAFIKARVPGTLDYFLAGALPAEGSIRAWPAALALIAMAIGAIARPRLSVLALGPVALTLVAAGMHAHPFGPIRHCTPLLPGVFLLVAAGVAEVGKRSSLGGAAFAAALVLAGALGIPSARHWYVEDTRGVISEARAHAERGHAST